jgi:hypothetical protein
MQLWHCVVFPFKKNLEDLPNLVKKKKQTYVLLILAKCVFATTSFDLCMPKGAHNFECIVRRVGVLTMEDMSKKFLCFKIEEMNVFKSVKTNIAKQIKNS